MNMSAIRSSHPDGSGRSTALCELFLGTRDGAATGFVLAKLASKAASGQPLLWVQERMAAREGGIPSIRGLIAWGVQNDLLRVSVRNATDLLWAMEEGLGCPNLSAVIGEIWGTPRVLDFTATKRLILRSQASGVPAYLLRMDAEPTLSAAHERWHVSALPSAAQRYDNKAPGDLRWALDLFRARWQRPGRWEGRYERAAHRLDLAAPVPDGAMAEGALSVRQASAG